MRLTAERNVAGECDRDGAVGIADRIGGLEGKLRIGRAGEDTVGEMQVRSLRGDGEFHEIAYAHAGFSYDVDHVVVDDDGG